MVGEAVCSSMVCSNVLAEQVQLVVRSWIFVDVDMEDVGSLLRFGVEELLEELKLDLEEVKMSDVSC